MQLTIQEIEDAGVREVLQTPGAALGSWAMLEGLLEPTSDGTPFVFREPLGQAREVKVALSGLFGRFVARAYLQRYCGLSFFGHVTLGRMMLDGRRQIQIARRPGRGGDLPDWVACDSILSNLTVAEAKGSYAISGPEHALKRARDQAERIDVKVGGVSAPLKRVAIATRWGMTKGGPVEPRISVHDPIDPHGPIDRDDKDAIFVGIVRHHVANMLAPLGRVALADSIRELATQDLQGNEAQALRRASSLLDEALRADSHRIADDRRIGELVGGIVVRTGPLGVSSVSQVHREALVRLDLRPVLVGFERELVQAAIDGDRSSIMNALADRPSTAGPARSDRAGSWIVPFEDETDDRG